MHKTARPGLVLLAGLPSTPLNWKYSPIAHPAYGAKYCNGAGDDAAEETTMVYSIAPASSSVFTTWATVDCF